MNMSTIANFVFFLSFFASCQVANRTTAREILKALNRTLFHKNNLYWYSVRNLPELASLGEL